MDKSQINLDPRLSHINVGAGVDFSIKELAELIAHVTGFKGQLIFDSSKPDGTPRKLLVAEGYANSALAEMLFGWRAQRDLDAMCRDHWRWQSNNPKGYV